MNGSSFDVTTIIFAALALFVVWKLRSVLGTRTDHDQNPNPDQSRRSMGNAKEDDGGNVVQLPGTQNEQLNPGPATRGSERDRWQGLAQPGSAVWEGLDDLEKAESGFDAHMFAEGSKSAYEMIVTAFAGGDRDTLRNLLSSEVMESFEQVIAEREKNGETVETTFVSLDNSKIEEVQIRDNAAHITVAFESQLISVTYDRSKTVIDGDPEKITSVSDVWTFSRPVGASDPNWRLVAT